MSVNRDAPSSFSDFSPLDPTNFHELPECFIVTACVFMVMQALQAKGFKAEAGLE